MLRSLFYQDHLNAVSRSFAFCIEELREPLRERIGLAYILCRLVDTVEDALWETPKDQMQAFTDFVRFLKAAPHENQTLKWASRFPNTIPESEKLLLASSHEFFTDLHKLPEVEKTILTDNIMNMTRGMVHFSGTHRRITVRSLQETNQYCFFVAGVVGELLTQLCEVHFKNFSANSHTYLRAGHFGLFLQKINLLKDQMTDLSEGRTLISNRTLVRESIIDHAVPALNYICEIPVENADYRTFSAWSLFLGLASLPFIDRSWREQKVIKITRIDALAILGEVKMNIDDNQWLRNKFATYLPHLGGGGEVGTEPAPWLLEIYRGLLHPSQLQMLGALPTTPQEASHTSTRTEDDLASEKTH